MNCLSGLLCEVGPTQATCTNHGFNGTEFKYQCTARLASNVELDSLNITCERKSDDDADGLEDSLVLKGNDD